MVVNQKRSKQKETGAKYRDLRKKRKSDMGRLPVMTKLGEKKTKTVRTLGGNSTVKLMYGDTVNIHDKKQKKSFKVKIKAVVENPANRHYVRRNVLTKGTVVETEKGKARITSRPGQDGSLNAVFVEAK
jgi:small subunit ribosomal protein S8e